MLIFHADISGVDQPSQKNITGGIASLKKIHGGTDDRVR